MSLPTRIYLTGFMGSGKSTIGRILANVLNYAFVDLDEAVEAAAGRPVVRLFAEEGEAAFRALEAGVLRETGEMERAVVALGGGTLANEQNLAYALLHGTVVYLHVTPERLTRRLRRSRRGRPLLQDENGRPLSEEALRDRIETMLAARKAFYDRAHLRVEVGTRRVGSTVDAVVEALRRR